MIDGIDQIEKVLIKHFKTLYSKESLFVAWFEKWEAKVISDESATWSEGTFSIEEIKSAGFLV